MSAPTVNSSSFNELWTAVLTSLAGPGYVAEYETESAFEDDVWKRVVAVARSLGLDVGESCLTSHKRCGQRSSAAWSKFCKEEGGPDVKVLGSSNRLDIVIRAPYGSIGLEVKCLGSAGHPGKLTQGLGQAVLALAHRDRTILIIHCGSVSREERGRLRETWSNISEATGVSLIVVP